MIKKIGKKILMLLSDISLKLNSQIIHLIKLKRFINLKQPKTFNEKLMWLKLNKYKNNQLISNCADKYKVRDYITECGCKEILNDLIGVWDNPEDIDFDKLPNSFVLKCNHGAGYNIICKDKTTENKDNIVRQLKKWMKEDYWKIYSEVQYKNIEKKIICERYLESKNNNWIEDYKIYCFKGNPKFIMVCTERNTGNTKYYFLNNEWKIMKINQLGLKTKEDFYIEKPNCIDEMFKYAEKLSSPFDFVRVDFYDYNGKVIFGELTFTPSACADNKYTSEALLELGNMIKI